MKKNFALLFSALALGSVQAAPEASPSGAVSNPSYYCTAVAEDDAEYCETGELMFFKPHLSEDTQLPLLFISRYCDVTKRIFQNTSGVVCFKAPSRKSVDPKKRYMTKHWAELKDSVTKANSGWERVSDETWVKVVKQGSGSLPRPQTKITFTSQKLYPDGKVAERATEDSLEVTRDTKYVLQYYPAGTVIQMFEAKKNLSDSQLTKFTIKSFSPIKEKATMQTQPRR